MSRPDCEEVTFQDALFCDEEWKLLQDWQKELYKSVMKEIHQALISLGPLIASTVSSLRAKEKNELCPMDVENSGSRHRLNPSPGDLMATPDVLVRIKSEEPQKPKNRPHSEEEKRNDCLRTGDLRKEPDILFKMNRKKPSHPTHPPDSGRRGRSECLSTGFPVLNTEISLRKEEPVSVSIDHCGTEPVACSTNPNSDYEIVSIHIKDENEVYFMDEQDSRRIKRTRTDSGNESTNRKKKVEDSMKMYERTSAHILAGTSNSLALRSSNMDTPSRSQMWAEAESAECESSFCPPLYFDYQHGSPDMGASYTYNEHESNRMSSQHPRDLPNIQTGTEAEKSYSQKTETSGDMSTSSRARPFACTQCEKSFLQKSHLTTHQRTHSGEKPYICIFCHKRFHRKDILDKHVRIHTGERPYKCTECEKTFVQRGHLTEHQKKHASSNATKYAV
ncbi:zinc finger protein 793-like isoform X1 [Ambystoma mexicanum]|uniref:zinc finger protein 793-like isoform X1 n=1 Tax=Ambystoma mexicanum TaxID=8296 RepID=UPI0037E97D6E